jgi:peptide/nickel transport system permease protein
MILGVPSRIGASQVAAILMLLVTVGVIVVMPLLPVYDPFTQDLSQGFMAPFASGRHLLGTDVLGRDVLSRLALAGRTSLLVAISALAISIAVGVGIGLVAGFFGGLAETAAMGVADLILAIPIMMLLVMVVAVVGPGAMTLAVVLGLTYWVRYSRIARATALSLRERDFVLAARTFGGSSAWIIRKHLLPQIVPQLAIMGSFDLGVLIILETGLSFLGLGVQPPTPSWGGMISAGQDFLQIDPWLCVLPGIAIWLLVSGVQILSQRFTSEGVGGPGPARGGA